MIFFDTVQRVRHRIERFRRSRAAGYLLAFLYISGTALVLGLMRGLRFWMEGH
jgi:hypothetical protein